MNQDWKISPIHENILKILFADFNGNEKFKILDAGSGRTSLSFLTEYFKNSLISAVIYPGDERKKSGIIESVKADNYYLEETDLNEHVQKTDFDIVLAHLLLGEAQKFSKEPFSKMLDSLFNIRTKYLVIVDILDDPSIDYKMFSEYISRKGKILKDVKEDKYVGFLIQKNLL